MYFPFNPRKLFSVTVLCLLPTLLMACGGGSDDALDHVKPTGAPLANVWFADSESYHPLDRLKSNGAFFASGESDPGPVNPAYSAADPSQSKWAINASATSEPAGHALTYKMQIDSSSNVSTAAVNAMRANLRIGADNGLITQVCKGFPDCYDNETAATQEFRVTVTAQVQGGNNTLSRSFLLMVRGN
ncbi:MAG: hypothetical protein K0M67_18445 [Thiobacillus sp.]|nr:hypothetical protein [Thiobacillus sp.]MDP2023069.1 hypothetical protein [Hydrogenophaga sp.]